MHSLQVTRNEKLKILLQVPQYAGELWTLNVFNFHAKNHFENIWSRSIKINNTFGKKSNTSKS